MAEVTIVGGDPPVDGMYVSVRVRRDFTITDIDRFLELARQAYRELHPDADTSETHAMVTSVADAMFAILDALVSSVTSSRPSFAPVQPLV